MKNKDKRLADILESPELKASVLETMKNLHDNKEVAKNIERYNGLASKKQDISHSFKKAGGLLLGSTLQVAGGGIILNEIIQFSIGGPQNISGNGLVMLGSAALIGVGGLINHYYKGYNKEFTKSYDVNIENDRNISKNRFDSLNESFQGLKSSLIEYRDLKKEMNELGITDSHTNFLTHQEKLDQVKNKIIDLVDTNKLGYSDKDFERVTQKTPERILNKNTSVFDKLKNALSTEDKAENKKGKTFNL